MRIFLQNAQHKLERKGVLPAYIIPVIHFLLCIYMLQIKSYYNYNLGLND